MNKEELKEVIRIISTHNIGEGEYCDTGADMDWSCRSDCVELAKDRLIKRFREV